MTGILTYGIDVSHYSGNIDWDRVLTPNIHFVLAKASELYRQNGAVKEAKDAQFASYWSELGKRNMRRGAYFFCHPGIDPQAAVSSFFSAYSPGPGDILPTLDVEDDYADNPSLSAADKVAQIGRMVDLVSVRIGNRKPMIYTKQRVWKALGNPDSFGGCPLWVIDYSGNDRPLLPAAWLNFSFWQYAQDREMDGVEGNYDPDYFNGRPEDMAAICL